MEYKIEMRNIEKSFPGVKAVSNVSMSVKPGEVFVLLGENGAGKSTLLKILSGVYSADKGEIFYEGEKVKLNSTKDAENYGIYMIYQELNLVPHLSVAENIFLGREPKNALGFVNQKLMNDKTKEILNELNVNINPKELVLNLSTAQSQMVEIARALMAKAKVVIMDEPTAAITNKETKDLFKQIEKLRKSGVSILYISHRLEEILHIGDRIFVMRDGAHIGTVNCKDTNQDELIAMMVGRDIGDLYPKQQFEIGEELLRVNDFSRKGILHNINFSVKRGEVLGFAGLMGAGRTELMQAIFGADTDISGDIFIKGKKITIKSPKDAVKNGLALVTEDRKNTGLILNMPVYKNITLSSVKKYTKKGIINFGLEENVSKNYVNNLKIKTPGINTVVSSLSGGNQQKTVLAKWLCTQAEIIILDEPTRGIDVGAKREIYLLINELTKMGKAVILVSSDLPEVIGMSNRIAVMANGRITGILSGDEASQVSVMKLATKTVAV